MQHIMDLTCNSHRTTTTGQRVVGKLSLPKGLALLVRAEENTPLSACSLQTFEIKTGI